MKQDQGIVLNYIFLSSNQSTCSRFGRCLTKMAEAEGSFEERFPKRYNSSLLLIIIWFVCICYKELALVSALIFTLLEKSRHFLQI